MVIKVLLNVAQIPEEEKNFGPHDRLIHVYHFMKDTAQNQVIGTFDNFFFLPMFLFFNTG